MTGNRTTWTRTALAAGVALACFGIAEAKPQAQGNLGLGLRELVELQAQQAQGLNSPDALRNQARAKLAVLDANGRVRVNVHLNGQVLLARLQAAARKVGA